jgi:hypothetical protein
LHSKVDLEWVVLVAIVGQDINSLDLRKFFLELVCSFDSFFDEFSALLREHVEDGFLHGSKQNVGGTGG